MCGVFVIIEKLPAAYLDIKVYMKHKWKEMIVHELIVTLHIEKYNKLTQKNGYVPNFANANLVEHGQ